MCLGKVGLKAFCQKIFIFDNFSAFSFSVYEKFNHKKIEYKVVENTNADLARGEIGIIFGDITDQKSLEIAIPSADRVLHLAANTGVQLLSKSIWMLK